ncbi:MAG: YibE/F family protein [Solirubrobacteraceae bacterium]
MASTSAGRVLIGAVALLAGVTVVGLLLLWPSGAANHSVHDLGPTTRATVTRSFVASCGGPSATRCRELDIDVHGRHSAVLVGPVATAAAIAPGTSILVSPVPLAQGQAAPPGYQPWQFVNIDRQGPLLWFALALLLLAVIVIRLRGLLAAVGVGLSLLLLVKFLVPAILAGEAAIPVALVCALAVMFITLILTSGIGPQTLAAALGIGSTLMLTCLLALFAVHFAHVDGRTDELSSYLATVNPDISLQGIVLAGMIVGALGVLADIAVTQASAVMVLRRTDPSLTPTRLYKAAFHVGRDHLSATIHTLVLAYAGASLPLLLITHSTGVGFTDALSTQEIAQPVIATLVGCIALVCAVPLTTGLAALLVARVPARALESVHAHVH